MSLFTKILNAHTPTLVTGIVNMVIRRTGSTYWEDTEFIMNLRSGVTTISY